MAKERLPHLFESASRLPSSILDDSKLPHHRGKVWWRAVDRLQVSEPSRALDRPGSEADPLEETSSGSRDRSYQADRKAGCRPHTPLQVAPANTVPSGEGRGDNRP